MGGGQWGVLLGVGTCTPSADRDGEKRLGSNGPWVNSGKHVPDEGRRRPEGDDKGVVDSSSPRTGLKKDDDAPRNKINDILQAAATDGTWKQIYEATLGKSGSPADPPPLQRY